MRLACPSCRAVYEIPDAAIGASRRLRCARCPAEWVATPATVTPALATQARLDDGPAKAGHSERPAAEPAVTATSVGAASQPTSMSDTAPSLRTEGRPSLVSGLRQDPRPVAPTAAAPRRPRALTAVLAWLLTFAMLGAGAASCYRWRGEVMAAWPPSQRVYAALGLH